MKKLIVALLAVISLGTVTIAGPVAFVAAYSCNGVETSLDYGCNKYSTDSISAILMYIINFLGIGVGIAVVAGIAWGGLTYARSGGDSGAAKEGIDTIRNAVIGLVLFIGLWSLANFFIPGGAFNLNKPVAQFVPTTPAPGTGSSDSGSGSGSGSSSVGSITSAGGVYNFRDAGASGVIKTGILYRSGYLAKADSTTQDNLAALLKGGTIIDLRLQSDITKDGADPKLDKVNHKNFYITGTLQYSKFVTDSASRKGFSGAIKYIANNSGPFLVHCTYGKDRTGWLVAMIMYALGANDSQVMTQFMASNNDLPAGKSVKESYLTDGLSAAKQKYGSVSKYLKNGLGLTTADVNALKKKLAA